MRKKHPKALKKRLLDDQDLRKLKYAIYEHPMSKEADHEQGYIFKKIKFLNMNYSYLDHNIDIFMLLFIVGALSTINTFKGDVTSSLLRSGIFAPGFALNMLNTWNSRNLIYYRRASKKLYLLNLVNYFFWCFAFELQRAKIENESVRITYSLVNLLFASFSPITMFSMIIKAKKNEKYTLKCDLFYQCSPIHSFFSFWRSFVLMKVFNLSYSKQITYFIVIVPIPLFVTLIGAYFGVLSWRIRDPEMIEEKRVYKKISFWVILASIPLYGITYVFSEYFENGSFEIFSLMIGWILTLILLIWQIQALVGDEY